MSVIKYSFRKIYYSDLEKRLWLQSFKFHIIGPSGRAGGPKKKLF